MTNKWMVMSLVASVAGISAPSFADQVTTYHATEQTSVTTSSATTAPAAAVPAAPMATDSQTQANAATDETNPSMAGTVQSVDRRNRSLVVQDSDGKNYSVSLNDNLRFYRHGQEVNYRDIEPNDIIQIRSRT